MKKLYTLLFIIIGAFTTVSAQKLTPNEQQARRNLVIPSTSLVFIRLKAPSGQWAR